MPENDELYNQYDFLLPSKYEGGYLVLALSEKISRKDLPEYFTEADIRITLEQLAERFNQGTWQTDRIIKTLNRFFIKNVPDQFGKYYLSDYALGVVKMIRNKLENPYKNYPIKKTFERHFTIRHGQIKNIADLETRYSRDFVAPHKTFIEDHLDGLQDELEEAHNKLSDILVSEALSAIEMVQQFVTIFRKFGERADDIGNAISSKERFLRMLNEETDKFYQLIMDAKTPVNDQEQELINTLKTDWETASAIYSDLSTFFEKVDVKLSMIHRQILFASEKLNELQENFSSRSNFRLQIKRLLNATLDQAFYSREGLSFSPAFPLKTLPSYKVQFFYPDFYFFDIRRASLLIEIEHDEQYEKEQMMEIERLAMQADLINEWVSKALAELKTGCEIFLDNWIAKVYHEENNIEVALLAGFELMQRTTTENEFTIEIQDSPETIKDLNLQLWNIRITNNQAFMLS